MFCTNCGTKVLEGEKFCTNCGASLTVNTSSPATSQQNSEQRTQYSSPNNSYNSNQSPKQNQSSISGGSIIAGIVVIAFIVFGIYKCSGTKDEKYAEAIIGTWVTDSVFTTDIPFFGKASIKLVSILTYYPNNKWNEKVTMKTDTENEFMSWALINYFNENNIPSVIEANGNWTIKDDYLCSEITYSNVNVKDFPLIGKSSCDKIIEINNDFCKTESDGKIEITQRLNSR